MRPATIRAFIERAREENSILEENGAVEAAKARGRLLQQLEELLTVEHAEVSIDTRSTARPTGILLTAPEVASRLGCNVQRVYELCRTEALPCIRIGRQVRVASGVLDDWIANGGTALAS